ncbi:MAG: helix-turn-helix transcriptional regulator [bacterium]|nr:helix-turn-helix transcriptional regulator [bacterium]
MRRIDRDIDRTLTRLRNAVRDRGFTQMEVQHALGWGRSYISQLLTKQKSVRFDQILMILNVIGVEPGEFFRGIYDVDVLRRPGPRHTSRQSTLRGELRRSRLVIDGLVSVLKQKSVITASELSRAIERVGRERSRYR